MEELVQATKNYVAGLSNALAQLPHEEIARLIDLLGQARGEGKRVFLAGNGGSAATASHMACDLQKTIAGGTNEGLRAVALSDNVPLMTAIANDRSFDEIFSGQLERLAEAGDILIVISGSGNSPNIIRCLETARRRQLETVGLLGMGGGEALQLVDIAIVVDSDDYGVIEDLHMVLNHVITACLKNS